MNSVRTDPTVYIVDDDKAVRDSLVYFLEFEAFAVETYASAYDFLEAVQPDWVGCLLLDVSMPGMTGLELQEVLAERQLQIPIIFITGHGDVPMSVKALKAGAFNFVEKPFDNEMLLNSIKEALAGAQLEETLGARDVNDSAKNFAADENYSESVVKTMRLPYVVLDEELRIVSTNHSFLELFHFPENEQAQLEGFSQYLWKIPQLRERVERVLSNNVELRNLEITVDYPKIGHVTLLVNVRQLQKQDDPRKHVLFVMEDISHRKQLEESLLLEKERAQITIDSINEAVITTDANAVVVHLNPIAEQLVGWSVTEARGKVIDKIIKLADEETKKRITNPIYLSLQQVKTFTTKQPAFLLCRNGQKTAVDSTASPISDWNGLVLGAVLVLKDVTEQRQITAELTHAASHDALTGLVNRREFEKRLQRAIESSKKRGIHHTLCFIDLDKFKIVNDTAGHAAGDDLLRQVTVLFQTKLRDRDTLARLGGDEFGLLIENCTIKKATEITEAMVEEISAHAFPWDGHSFTIGASVGLVPITSDAKSPSDLLGQADVACYGAKRRGRGCVHLLRTQKKDHHGTLHK